MLWIETSDAHVTVMTNDKMLQGSSIRTYFRSSEIKTKLRTTQTIALELEKWNKEPIIWF